MSLVTSDMLTRLVAQTDLVSGQTLFIGREPASPANVVTLLDTPGAGPQLLLNPDGTRYGYGTFQVRIRHVDYDKAMERGHEIVDKLHNLGNLEINGTFYGLVAALDEPALLDWDENNRARVVVNFEIQRRQPVVA